jgi:hypothetical protein
MQITLTSTVNLDQVFSNCLLSRPSTHTVFASQCHLASHDSKLYANDGVFSGVTPVITSTSGTPISVGIVAGSWPGWAYPFAHCSFNIKWILLVGPIIDCYDDVS